MNIDFDKLLIIISVTIMYGLTVWLDQTNANEIILPILTGIFGMTTGSMRGKQ
jgi:TctA family transporter